MEYIDSILKLIIVFGIALNSPGPNFVLIIRYSLSYSKKIGLLASFGIATGVFVHALYILFGVGAIIVSSSFLVKTLYFTGGIYLIYLGIKALIKDTQERYSKSKKLKQKISESKAFSVGFFTCLLNPKAIFYYVAIITLVLDSSIHDAPYIIYASVMYLETFIYYALLVYILSYIKKGKRGVAIRKWMNLITGPILLIFGLKLIWNMF